MDVYPKVGGFACFCSFSLNAMFVVSSQILSSTLVCEEVRGSVSLAFSVVFFNNQSTHQITTERWLYICYPPYCMLVGNHTHTHTPTQTHTHTHRHTHLDDFLCGGVYRKLTAKCTNLAGMTSGKGQ